MSILVLVTVLLLLIVSVMLFIVNIKPIKTRVVVSLTTSPIRISKMRPVLDSLMNQTVKPEKIYLNLPELYRGTDPYVIPDWFQEYPQVVINRVPKDYGPITKLVGILGLILSDENVLIFYCDDDISYPCRMLETHLKIGQPASVNALDLYQGFYPSGYAGVSIHRSLIGSDFMPFLETCLLNKDCYLSDDMVIGEYFHRKGVPINKVKSTLYNYTVPCILQGLQSYALLSDSLWLQEGLGGIIDNHYSKYCRCKEHLESYFGKQNRYVIVARASEIHLPTIHDSVDSLLNQTYQPDQVYLIVQPDLPLPSLPKQVTVVRTTEHPLVEIQKLIDPNMDINVLFCDALSHPDCMVTVHNQHGTKSTLNCLPYLGPCPRLATGVSIHRSLLTMDLKPFLEQPSASCRDDLMLWEYFKRKKVASHNVYTVYYNPLKYKPDPISDADTCLEFMEGNLFSD